MRRMQILSWLALPAGLLLMAGCGGGAAEPPTVTVRPADANAADSGNGGETSTGNGDSSTAPAAEGYGTFKGRVVLMGNAPSLPPLVAQGQASRDPAVCAADAAIPNESVVVNDGGLANVFIYLQRKPKNGKETAAHQPTEAQVFDQKGCQYIPHAMVMQTGKAVIVTNSDPVDHNVKTKPKFNQEFNPTLKQGAEVELVYRRAERVPVAVECNLHNWMRAYQLPLDHPYAVVTAADGSFEMNDLPVGEHTFKVWQERGGELTEYTVTIPADGAVVEKTIEVDAAQLTAFHGQPSKSLKLSLNP